MSVQIALGVYLVVHALGVYMLRASGTWQVLFAGDLALQPDKTPDPLRVAPRGWIENHTFWDDFETEVEAPAQADPERVFWGSGRERDVG